MEFGEPSFAGPHHWHRSTPWNAATASIFKAESVTMAMMASMGMRKTPSPTGAFE